MNKRPPTAYNFVTKDSELKDRLRGEHPEWSHQNMMSECARLWKEGFSDEEKQKYLDLAKEASDNWVPPDDDSIETIKKHKRPQSAYFHFAASRRGSLKEENPKLKVTELSKLIGAEWKELTEDDKKPFIDLHEKEKQELIDNPIIIEKKIKKPKVDKNISSPDSDQINALTKLISSLTNEVSDLSKRVNELLSAKIAVN